VAATATLAVSATAQVRQIPSTGCGNVYPTTTGSPAIGQGFGIIAGPCRTVAAQPVIFFGASVNTLTLPVPPACTSGCVMATRPLIVLQQSAFRALIPNDRSLIGVKFVAQTGCVEAIRPAFCITLHGGLAVQITA
ncbi:MAG: hypothetical protein KDC87_08090, partial [Planctomycetes bacterium]|nr:hypothetical protein [Planctomycetota bacterium]